MEKAILQALEDHANLTPAQLAAMCGKETGDVKKLIETYNLPDIEVLMAGHHSSKNSTSKELLDAVTPGTVIISVGSNSYGHPAEDTLRRLARAGCDIYRTDRHGTVYLSFD